VEPPTFITAVFLTAFHENIDTGTLSDRLCVTFTLHRSETLTNHEKIISGEWEIHIYLSIAAKAQLKPSDKGPKHEAEIRSTPSTRVVFGELCRGWFISMVSLRDS